MEDSSDDVLARLLGGNLQTATLRLVLYLAIASAVVGVISMMV